MILIDLRNKMKKKSRKNLKNPYLTSNYITELGKYIDTQTVQDEEVNIEEIPKDELKAFNLGSLIGSRDIYRKILLKILDETSINDLLETIIHYYKIPNKFKDNEEALEIGYGNGRMKAIYNVFKWKFNLKRIENEYYRVSDKIENFD